MKRPAWVAAWVGGGLLFALLATANAAGYRYGASDQAFYIPVTVRAANPEAFPRDSALLDAQGRLMVLDELLGGLLRRTGLSIEVLFLAGYLLSLGLIWCGLLVIGSRVYRNPMATAALGAAFTLRHQIPRTSANSFEPYFHPRMLAFGIGLLAVATLLRRRPVLAIALVAACALVHVTTGAWFAVLIGVALLVVDARFRRIAASVAVAGVALGAWMLTSGPLRGALVTMDAQWLQAVASKDTLFATGWPLWAWFANLALLALLWWAHRVRVARGDATLEESGLVWGATALVALFLSTLPAVAANLALTVQLQIPRVFWLVDFVATVYVLAALADTPGWRRRAPPIAAGVLVAFSVIRGTYVMLVEHPERPLFAVRIAESPWEDAMRWLGRQPMSVHVLADPGHAWKHGASVRVSPGRDVFLEEVKDAALAIYSRDVAMRVVERTTAIGDFTELNADRARALAAQYDVDYLVTESDLPLPQAYRNDQFRIYALR